MNPAILAARTLALALAVAPPAHATPAPGRRLPADRDVYLLEDDLVYARFLALARDGTYRQFNRDEHGSVEVDQGRWEQDRAGALLLRSAGRALRPRALWGGPLSVVITGRASRDALPELLAALRRFLATYPDAVFAAGTAAEIGVPDARVHVERDAPTFSRNAAEALAGRVEQAIANERTGTGLLEPVGSNPEILFALPGAAYGEAELPGVRHQFPRPMPPFYFARVNAETFAHELGRWRPFHLPGEVP